MPSMPRPAGKGKKLAEKLLKNEKIDDQTKDHKRHKDQDKSMRKTFMDEVKRG